MAEPISARVNRIIAGTAGSIIGAIEDMAPEMIMEQAIVEVEKAIEEVGKEKDRVISARLLTENRIRKAGEEYNRIAGDIEVAADKGRDDLATVGISRQMEIEESIPALKESIEHNLSEEGEYEAFVLALYKKKEDMQNDLIIYRREADKLKAYDANSSSGNPRISAKVKAERAGNAFDRMLNRQLGVSERSTPKLQSAKDLSELSELSRTQKIQDRLLEIKRERQLE